MTTEEIESRICYLQKKLEDAERDNMVFRKGIAELEEGDAQTFDIMSRWETSLSNCFGEVKTSASRLDQHSNFGAYCLKHVKSILAGAEVCRISESFTEIRASVREKMREYEKEIDSNNRAIAQYRLEISQLRAMQPLGVE